MKPSTQKKGRGIPAADRKQVTRDQILAFFAGYSSEWRHIKMLSIKRMLKIKYDFFPPLIEEMKIANPDAGEHTIAQQVTTGLLFDAIQCGIQYVEDLFALLKAAENPDYFIKRIVQYDAGRVKSLIKNFDFNVENVRRSFHFAPALNLDDEPQTAAAILDGLQEFAKMLKKLQMFYLKNEFFYNQYKHGLKVVLTPYGRIRPEEVEMDKQGKRPPFKLIAFDAVNFHGASRNQRELIPMVLIPKFTDKVMEHYDHLQREDNLLRYVMSPDDVDINELVELAQFTKASLQILVYNFRNMILGKQPLELALPSKNINEQYLFKINANVEEETDIQA